MSSERTSRPADEPSVRLGEDRHDLGGTPVRLALSPDEAAASLGVSRDYFDRHVLPELRIVRRGRRRLVPVRELERWLDAEAALAVGQEREAMRL